MRQLNTVTALVFLALGLYMAIEAPPLILFTGLGPGPGFIPLVLGVSMVTLSTVWLGQIYLQPAVNLGKLDLPDLAGIARVAGVLVALLAFAQWVDLVGYQLSMFALLLFLLIALGRQRPWVTAVVSLGGSFGLYYLFTNVLQVSLPPSGVAFLANLGL